VGVVCLGVALFLSYGQAAFPAGGLAAQRVLLRWLIPIAALVVVFILMMRIFLTKIYFPIRKIEQAIHVVSDVGDIMEFELDIESDSELFEVSESINKMLYRLREFANREYKASLLVKQAELNALQTQINPHFLYNTLDSIRGLALKEGHKNIAVMTKALSGLFRYSISKTEDMSSLREEIKNVENYLTIQQLRFPDKFVFIKEVEQESGSEIMDFLLPKLTIQPIVENAVFHGLETKLENGKIVLHAYTTEKRLVISIEDDGVGIDAEQLERINQRLRGDSDEQADGVGKQTNIALSNVNERIKLFFGSEYGVKVMSTQNLGTSVEIVLPLAK
jgi:two-component system sensor histidine kinase YesM